MLCIASKTGALNGPEVDPLVHNAEIIAIEGESYLKPPIVAAPVIDLP
jgi:hypothetical protein